MEKYDRSIRFFGAQGQRILNELTVVVAGSGGLGQHVIQQLAYLGVKHIIVIDDEELSETNKNRYVLAWHDDPVPGLRKVELVKRTVHLIDPSIVVTMVHANIRSREAFDAMRKGSVIFGCLDDDGPRFVLNEFALAYGKDYFDLASDTESKEAFYYGGRVAHVATSEPGCLVCMDVLDMTAVSKFLSSANAQRDRALIYGVDKSDLQEAGPSVVSLNGIIASLAVMEFMLHMTSVRRAKRLLEYRGNMGIVASKNQFSTDCHYCKTVRGQNDAAGLKRYIESQQ